MRHAYEYIRAVTAILAVLCLCAGKLCAQDGGVTNDVSPADEPNAATEDAGTDSPVQDAGYSVDMDSLPDEVDHAKQPTTPTCVDVGVEIAHVEYDEPGLMTESGFLYGVFGAFTFYPGDIMCSIYASYVMGDLEYEGGVQNSQTGEVAPLTLDTPNTIVNLRGIIGLRPKRSGQVAFVPYAGLGHRELVDDLPGKYGYKREQTYLYIPFGMYLAWANGFAVNVEYDFFVEGENNSLGMKFTQDSGYGYRMSARYASPEKPADLQQTSFSAEVFLQYWNVGESDHVRYSPYTFYEPENDSLMIGIRAGVVL